MKRDSYMQSTGSHKSQYTSKTKFNSSRDISIWLDYYDDIFSDFDPRPVSERTLSDDFLVQVRKVSHESKEMIHELKLLMPHDKRNLKDEEIIVKRILDFFKLQNEQYQRHYRSLWKKALLLSVVGMIIMFVASYISVYKSHFFWSRALLVIFEPMGWFLVWSGLDRIFFSSKQDKKEFDFYHKLSKSKVVFSDI